MGDGQGYANGLFILVCLLKMLMMEVFLCRMWWLLLSLPTYLVSRVVIQRVPRTPM
ncbi:hypothetical protein GGS26DRAFT_567218 [Hypomontagnella submonticulosa]|nr:hypothetical protein GGS26DRAFT_567218 [Hypomontagnella submonticulosa]